MNLATGRIYNSISKPFFYMVIVLVVLNIFTPLRLITDGIRYLNILEFLKGNLDSGSVAAHDFLPHGYPWFLYLLSRLHLLNAASITIANIFSVFIACILIANLLKIESPWLYISLVFIAFVNVKHFTLPVSDQLFTLTFVAGIYLWTKTFNGKVIYAIPALIVTGMSIYLRSAGVAVLLGVLFYTCYLNRGRLIRDKKVLVFLGIMFLMFGAVFIFYLKTLEKKVDYLKQLNLESMAQKPFSIVERLLLHIKEIGEITLNIPYDKLSPLIKLHAFDFAQILICIIGLLSLYIYYKAVKILRLYRLLIFWVGLAYLALIFLWPFYDTRFLIPLFPFLTLLLFYYLFSILKSNILKAVPIALYVVFGLAGLFYSDAMSLNKQFFLKHYGFDPNLTKAYQIHFENERNNTSPIYNINNDNTLYLLETYDGKPGAAKSK